MVPPHLCLYLGPSKFCSWAIHGWAPSGAQVPFKILNKGVKDFGLEKWHKYSSLVTFHRTRNRSMLILRYDFFSSTNFVEIVKTSLSRIWFLSDCFRSSTTCHKFYRKDKSCKDKRSLMFRVCILCYALPALLPLWNSPSSCFMQLPRRMGKNMSHDWSGHGMFPCGSKVPTFFQINTPTPSCIIIFVEKTPAASIKRPWTTGTRYWLWRKKMTYMHTTALKELCSKCVKMITTTTLFLWCNIF